MKISAKWLFVIAFIVVVWGTFRFLEYRNEKAIAERILPAISRALEARLAKDDARAFCVRAPGFPYAQTERRNHWVKLESGLSECRSGLTAAPEGACWNCESLRQAGLLEKTELDYGPAEPDSSEYYPRKVMQYDLTSLGRRLYYTDYHAHDRTPLPEACAAGTTAYRSAEPVNDASDDRHAPGFCFAKGLKLHAVLANSRPLNRDGKTYVTVKYQAELIDADPVIREPSLREALARVPVDGDSWVLPAEQITGVFTNGGRDFVELTDQLNLPIREAR